MRHRRVLHLLLSIGETSAPYNEHCLPAMEKREISICTYFGSDLVPPDAIRHYGGDGSPLGFVRALRRALRAGPYDLIHAHAPHVGALFALCRPLLPALDGARTVHTVHNCYENYERRHHVMMLPIFGSFDRVVCCSESALESFPSLFRRLAGARLGAVQNGLDLERVDRITRTAEKRAPEANFAVTTISRLVPLKNPTTVLEAFLESSRNGAAHAELTVLGVGSLREELERRRAEAGKRGAVRFLGLIPRDDVYRLMARSDAFVSASRGEGLPIAVLEAMACGCPVILSDIAPHREIARGFDFIPLLPPDDVAGFARELDRLRAMTNEERSEVGRSCRDVVQTRFSLRRMLDGYADVYSQLWEGARS